MTAEIHTEFYFHARLIMSMVVSLSMARLLTGAARFVQHPSYKHVYWIHLGWSASMLLSLIHFWWWEFWLTLIPTWTLSIYLFLIGYAILYYLLCALLFPDNLEEYNGYEDYFFSRRKWFFGLLALTFVFDIIDTQLKGPEYFSRFSGEYLIRVPVFVSLCIVAMLSTNRRFHATFLTIRLAYQLSWILRLFGKLQ